MENSFLLLPKERFSFIHFLIESISNWFDLDSICVNSSAYNRAKESPYLMQDATNLWISKGTVVDGKSHPLLSYELKQISFDLWEVLWIEYDGIRYQFSRKPCGKSVYISY